MSGCFSGCFGGAASGSKVVPGKLELLYWPILAKNIAPAIALEIGGFQWELGAGPGSKGTGDLWAEWLEMKFSTVWCFLPNLKLPAGQQIGSELAILQFLARKVPALAGTCDRDFMISQELLHQSEELYQKLTAKVPTIMAKDKSPTEFEEFWCGADKTTHSNKQGLQVYLAQLEDFYAKSHGSGGKFTSTGTTIGEIKLYATLKLVVLVRSDALASYQNLEAFMKKYEADPKVAAIMGQQFSKCSQYFIAPP